MEQRAVDAEGDSLERSRLIQAFLKVRIRGTSALNRILQYHTVFHASLPLDCVGARRCSLAGTIKPYLIEIQYNCLGHLRWPSARPS